MNVRRGLILSLLCVSTGVAASPVASEIDRAFTGLVAVVEDDIGRGPELRLKKIQSKACKSKLVGKKQIWTVDWKKVDAVALEDTFIYLSAPSVKLAIVGDASQPDQLRKLQMLHRAMSEKALSCQKSPKPN